MLKPRTLLHLEGATVLTAASILYHQSHGSWLWFAMLFLAPDLFMLGYLAGKKIGASIYNLGHTYAAPLLLLLILSLTQQMAYAWLVLIWLAHIGFDRLLGYGLKYETSFKDTHLQRV